MVGRVARFCLLSAVALGGSAALAGEYEPLENVRETVHGFLLDQTGSYRVEPRIEVRRVDPRLRLARCDRGLEAFVPTGRELLGNVTIGVRCSGPTPWSLYVQATVQVIEPVVVAARPLTRGRLLQPGDVMFAEQDLAQATGGYLTDLEAVVGMVMTRSIRAGMAIGPNYLAPPDLVRRGERVSITAQGAGVEVHMEGEALQNGARGQTIRVRNLSSRREIEAAVVAPGRVEVRL